ncbi:hypothetical protein SLA_6480 [Streptomyces laurentii]|uniref:Peptidase inhibitor family I36 n=1 Tax=Streptomyces laurentii TaxID=39478 RepID=A0A160P687_STRLU|nr:hypothetical protein SLA_6480 [Streptomyces laurentii]
MNNFTRAVAGGAAAVALAGGLLGTSAGSASADAGDCARGAVCIYPEGTGIETSKPTNAYWSRGVHQLYGQYNWHFVFNRQTDGWTVRLCKGSNGTNCGAKIEAGWAVWANLTDINSILIEP